MKSGAATNPPGRSSQRRREILDAALACFADQGISGTSIEDICKRSGASIGSLYHQYGSKFGVAAALYLDSLRDFQHAVTHRLHPDVPAPAGVRLIIGAHIDWCERHPLHARFLQETRHTESVEAHAAEISACNREFAGHISLWARSRIEACELHSTPTDLFIAQLFGPTHEYIRARLSGRDCTSVRKAKSTLVACAVRALCAAQSAQSGSEESP